MWESYGAALEGVIEALLALSIDDGGVLDLGSGVDLGVGVDNGGGHDEGGHGCGEDGGELHDVEEGGLYLWLIS
jgi:hypothetical protein